MARATASHKLRYILVDSTPYYHDTYKSADEERDRLSKLHPKKHFRLLKIIGCHGVPDAQVLGEVKKQALLEKSTHDLDDEYIVWCASLQEWFGTNCVGYTTNPLRAKVLTREEAIAYCSRKSDKLDFIPVRRADALETKDVINEII